MNHVIAFDTETHLISPGVLAPPLVCIQWQNSNTSNGPLLLHRDDAHTLPLIRGWLRGDDILVGHNVAYDMGVIAAKWPDLLPLIFAKYDRNQVTDTKIRDQLLNIARGTFRSEMGSDGELYPVKYDLQACCLRHFRRHLPKEGFRLFYRALDGTPNIGCWDICAAAFQAWVRQDQVPWVLEALEQGLIKQADIDGLLAAQPTEARTYALADATTTLELYGSQERIRFQHPRCKDVLADEFRKARAAFGLHLSSAWGLYTDADAVEAFGTELEAEYQSVVEDLQAEGLVRANGSADTKVAKAAMEAACAELCIEPIRSKKTNEVSLSSEACARVAGDVEDPDSWASIIGQYARFQTLRKQISNDLKMLRAGAGDIPIQPRYDFADTGRTRAAKPNIQAIGKGKGIRECFRPRDGYVFIQADYPSLELYTLAAWCLEVIGHSELAKALNAGQDVHCKVAAEFLGRPYDEVLKESKNKKSEAGKKRQASKAVNYGVPGGLGAPKLSRYAKTNYGVDMSIDDAKRFKQTWLGTFPEMNEFFAIASRATSNPEKIGEEEHVFVGRYRGGCRYSALCNGRFQGLGADCATNALWLVTVACYTPGSPLYGCHVVAFVHDELILECPIGPGMPAAAAELGRLMDAGANVYLTKVPIHVEPQAMTVWSKDACPVYVDGVLVPWTPEWAAEQEALKKAA